MLLKKFTPPAPAPAGHAAGVRGTERASRRRARAMRQRSPAHRRFESAQRAAKQAGDAPARRRLRARLQRRSSFTRAGSGARKGAARGRPPPRPRRFGKGAAPASRGQPRRAALGRRGRAPFPPTCFRRCRHARGRAPRARPTLIPTPFPPTHTHPHCTRIPSQQPRRPPSPTPRMTRRRPPAGLQPRRPRPAPLPRGAHPTSAEIASQRLLYKRPPLSRHLSPPAPHRAPRAPPHGGRAPTRAPRGVHTATAAHCSLV
ncbi:MAG: hypothetical protein J3K34DRAFT_434841 [Monoraphidium minutum]|nr:MAG: hypothetical protein J3K34DRAFT_434841 [Monoraphidium minutum]